MKKYILTCLVLGIFLAVGAVSASAQQQTLYREITGFGGMTFGPDENEATGGVALTFNASPRIGIEGEAGAIFANDTTFNGSMNLVFNFGTGTTAFVPYIIGGGGVMANGGTKITINGGLGAKIFLAYNVALRADFRAFFYSEGDDAEDIERIYGGLTFFF
jgi:hypothetical protein